LPAAHRKCNSNIRFLDPIRITTEGISRRFIRASDHGRTVDFCFCPTCGSGHGAAFYSPLALWRAAHEELPITVVIMSNREYNVLKNFMRGRTGYILARTNRFIALDIDQPVIDCQARARLMSVPARRIEKASEIAPAIEAAIASGKPNLLEIIIST
jgi:thiamine pyrophosphate-dependent acetolactate synthase large subunit-like protein